MRIVIDNQDRIDGSDSDFKVEIPVSIDQSNKQFQVIIEQVLISEVTPHDGGATLPFLYINSDTLLTNTIESNGSTNSTSLCLVPFLNWDGNGTEGFATYYYQGSGEVNFKLNKIDRIQHFWLSSRLSDSFTALDYFISIVLNLKEI